MWGVADELTETTPHDGYSAIVARVSDGAMTALFRDRMFDGNTTTLVYGVSMGCIVTASCGTSVYLCCVVLCCDVTTSVSGKAVHAAQTLGHQQLLCWHEDVYAVYIFLPAQRSHVCTSVCAACTALPSHTAVGATTDLAVHAAPVQV
jgi:hypothetical protein